MVMVMVMVLNLAYTGPLASSLPLHSRVAPAPCFARARPCLDVVGGVIPSLVQRPLWPLLARAAHTSGRPVPMGAVHGRYRAHEEITVWCFKPPLAYMVKTLTYFFITSSGNQL